VNVRRLVDEDDWRAARARALEAEACSLTGALLALEDVEELLDRCHDEPAATEVRSLAGLLRSRRDDRANDAARIRARTATTQLDLDEIAENAFRGDGREAP